MADSGRLSAARDAILEWVLLRNAERRAMERRPSAARLDALDDAAAERLRAAKLLGEDVGATRIALLRESIRIAATAASAATGVETATVVERACEQLDARERELARTMLDGPLDAPDGLTPEQRRATRRALERLVDFVRSTYEPRTVATLRTVRFLRLVALSSLLALGVVHVVGRVRALPNVALGAKVISSSGHGFFFRSDATPDTLVDGETEASRPFVASGTSPTIVLDLGSTFAIRRVRIVNRRDRHFDEALPLIIEVSQSQSSWHEVGRVTEHFREWETPVGELRARYVRVRTDAMSLGLNEVEVYGTGVP